MQVTAKIDTIDRFAHAIEIHMQLEIVFVDGSVDGGATVTFTKAYDAPTKAQRWDVPRVDVGAFDLQYGELTRAQMVEVYTAVLAAACDRFEEYVQDLL